MSLLPTLYRHHKWANLTLIDHLAGMTPEDLARRAPGGFGTIHETLFHMVANEARFIESFDGATIELQPMPSELPSCGALREMAARQGDRLIQLAETQTEDSQVSGTFNGQPYTMPAFLPLFQSYHHGVEHRTNITSILATYDLPTPNLDLWSYQDAGLPR